MRGFKTFGKKVSVTLDKGLTVITGPNGSGKSNVMDGLKFALGELSAKELRGASLTDIIHKTSLTPSLTQQARSAWVSVQFDNMDRRIPIEANSVSISREFRKGGEGVYRLNGRRISRKYLNDIMSSANIQVSGFNLVAQHAVTRLAEVTSEERRRIVEDMVGIAVYDVKRQESQQQLQIADMNLRVASAKISEVTQRVESLEKERNNFMRFSTLQVECRHLEAKLVSGTLRKIRELLIPLQDKSRQVRTGLDHLKNRRDELSVARNAIEEERRKFEQDVISKQSAELFETERKIADLSAQVTTFATEIRANEARLETLTRQRDTLQEQMTELSCKTAIEEQEHTRLQAELQESKILLAEKEQAHSRVEQELTQRRQRLGEDTKRTEELGNKMLELSQQSMRLDAEARVTEVKIEFLCQKRDTAQVRVNEYRTLLEDMSGRLEELSHLMEGQTLELSALENKLVEATRLIEEREQGIHEASPVLEKAQTSIVEFETQRDFMHSLAPEEMALRMVEEMASSGALNGVLGRLENLIVINEKCRKAAEAASTGWLKALVVRDVETAIECAEILKRTGVGRIKLIPIGTLAFAKPIDNLPDIPGVLGRLIDFIEYPAEIKPAVDFVFGDTVIADNQRAAFLSSLEGARTVVLNGDLHELGGGIESGYYREALDFTSMIPADGTVSSLAETIRSLQILIERGRSEISHLGYEIEELKEDRSTAKNAIDRMNSQIAEIRNKFEMAEKSLQTTLSTLESTLREIDSLANELNSLRVEKEKTGTGLYQLKEERDKHHLSAETNELSEIEDHFLSFTRELNVSKRQQIEIEGKIASLRSSMTAITQSLDQRRIEFEGIIQETTRTGQALEATRVRLATARDELKILDEAREALSDGMSGIQERRQEFETGLQRIDGDLNQIFGEYDSLNSEMSELTASIKEREAQISFQREKLKELKQDELTVDPEDIGRTERTLVILQGELRDIGAVNQLAPQQYEEIVGNYKQLSVRINELEREKLAIIRFMNELDQKKRSAFMEALDQVNKNFEDVFAKITGSGHGRLVLEKLESPFEGGLDIFLQFPDKAELPIGSASGGEKSVASICFLLALQSIHPLPFYVFDEIDAHLDVLNAQKLADLLKTRSKGSQFMVISLRDTTISRANRVYGVFVQEGMSQVVSLPTKVAS